MRTHWCLRVLAGPALHRLCGCLLFVEKAMATPPGSDGDDAFDDDVFEAVIDDGAEFEADSDAEATAEPSRPIPLRQQLVLEEAGFFSAITCLFYGMLSGLPSSTVSVFEEMDEDDQRELMLYGMEGFPSTESLDVARASRSRLLEEMAAANDSFAMIRATAAGPNGARRAKRRKRFDKRRRDRKRKPRDDDQS